MENQDGSSIEQHTIKDGSKQVRKSRKVPPSFDFFPDDFIGGTYHLSPTVVGIYLRLLCWQWSHGEIPKDESNCSRVCGCSLDEWRDAWRDLESKFPKSLDGTRRNDRLNNEREHKTRIRETNAKNGSRRWVNKDENASFISKPDSKLKRKETTVSRLDSMPKSVMEVENWCSAHNVKIDSSAFFNYYASQGWKKANGKPVTDWHACARGWESRQIETAKTKAQSGLYEVQRQALTQDAFSEVFK